MRKEVFLNFGSAFLYFKVFSFNICKITLTNSSILGLGYTIAIFRYTIELHNIMLASLTIVLISDMFREKHRSNIISCEGETSGMNCLIMYPIRNFTQQCPTPFNMRQRNETCYVATQYHFRYEAILYIFLI